ncbi:MAG: hypothetical protein CSA62_07690 [Planctomycetota bacterium]|nr:MAG: hypothetical protein CSA62_07690 [Planctomycetota bacterium]
MHEAQLDALELFADVFADHVQWGSAAADSLLFGQLIGGARTGEMLRKLLAAAALLLRLTQLRSDTAFYPLLLSSPFGLLEQVPLKRCPWFGLVSPGEGHRFSEDLPKSMLL